MKKFTIMAFAFVLTATMFAGCRRNPDTTGSTAAPTTKPAATAAPTTKPAATQPTATKPAETTRPDGTGVLPDATDLMPSGTTGTEMPRSHRGPRY